MQYVAQPFGINFRGPIEPEIAKLERDHRQALKRAVFRTQHRQVHQHQIVPKRLVTFDALVIRDEIAATVQDEPAVVNFDAFRMMR